MINLIIGTKGFGKTKILIDRINEAADVAHGNLVCIEKGATLTYDVKSSVRLVDVDEYSVTGYDALYAFICGLHSGNYDISEIYVDSILKIGGKDFEALGKFFDWIDELAVKNSMTFTFTVSAAKEDLPASVLKYA